MLVIGVDRGIWLEFPINPVGNKALKLRRVVTSSTVSPLSKLNEGSGRQEEYQYRKAYHF
jgi:hypothetical protein